MDAENGFLIAGKVYGVPTLDSLTTDEVELMYRECEITQEDFAYEDGETDEEYDERKAKLMRRPGFLASLAKIAYQRGNPAVKPEQVRLVVGKTNRMELFSMLRSAEEEPDEIPLASTSEPSESSLSGSPVTESSARSSSVISGADSVSDSEGQAGEVVNIGTTRSDTSSISAPEKSVASAPAI